MKKAIVKWVDITSTNGWSSQNAVDNFITADNNIVHHIGYLYEEDENQVVLVDSYFEEKDLYGTVNRIPKGCIISITELVPKIE